ncbi:ribonuclease HII [Clostridium saudiense]|uniref:Ribonuclease HII n=1 Tax=Clostridium saudiense TaxID=1414720 RepID=A0ABS2FH55_9CLOT|nr:ribonuclease HII [Clostridium saudiense]MBM6819689.1 ribonuclease HII [Clostridium saudiense]
MLKLKIFKLNEFLQIVNECIGPVNIIHSDGKKKNINKSYSLQEELKRKYKKNKNCLCLELNIPIPQDYMNIVCFSISDH